MDCRLPCILLLAVCFGSSSGVYKRWLKNTDWENADNWNAGRAPCGNDRVIVPEDSPVVYIQMNTTLQEVTFPRNGEIIFGSNIQLIFTQQASEGCPSSGGDVEFTAVQPESWVDPDNWCSTSTELGDCQPNSPIDTENVPCVTDDVVFLRQQAYYVTLSQGLNLTMKSLKITGTSFTTPAFAQFANSTDGRKMFPPPTSSGPVTSVTISRQSCDDIGGCACGNDQGQMKTAICGIRSKACERAKCRSPVTPVGACCDLCGVVFNGTRGRGFNLATFKNTIKTFLDTFPNVTSAVSITSTGTVQLVLTDDNGGVDSLKLAGLIKQDIDDDLRNGGHKYMLDYLSVSAESGASTAGHTGGGAAPLEGGSIAGIIIGVLILLAIVVVGVLIYKRGRPNLSRFSGFPDFGGMSRSFSRFGVQSREPPSGASTPPISMGAIHHRDPGFPNPLYDAGPFDDSVEAREMNVIDSSEEQPTFDAGGPDRGFNNPLYGTQAGAFFTGAADTTSVDLGDDDLKKSEKL